MITKYNTANELIKRGLKVKSALPCSLRSYSCELIEIDELFKLIARSNFEEQPLYSLLYRGDIIFQTSNLDNVAKYVHVFYQDRKEAKLSALIAVLSLVIITVLLIF